MLDLGFESYGKLWVLKPTTRDKYGEMLWLCLCACGNKTTVRGNNLRKSKGNTRSCGCEKGRRSHEHSPAGKPSATYRAWGAMRQRATNPNHESYRYYGGRGITICERWASFENFLADMGEKPEGRTLDRTDNDGNYESSNCRWATPSEQAKNQRRGPRKI